MANQNNSDKIVRGTVSDGRNNKLANLLVQAFDCDMRSEGFLGECLTDAKGEYKISYREEQYNRAEKRTADLAVKVYSATGKILLYDTDLERVVFNASDNEVIDVVISGEIKAEENEFDFILGEISGLIGRVKVSQLQENAKHRDITFLSKETGISAEKLEHLVVAHRLNAESRIDAAFFYALLRKNTLLKSDFTETFRSRLYIDINVELMPLLYEAAVADAEMVVSDVKAAVEELIVPARVADKFEENFKLLRKYRQKAEDYYKNEHPKKVLDIIERFLLEDKIGEIGRIFEENKNDLQTFFKKITDESFFKSASKTSDAKTTIALSALLGFDDEIISQVRKSQNIKKPEDVKKLAKLNKADWKRELAKSSGKKLDKNLIDFHASSMARKMEKEFPGVAFTAQLEREEKPVLENHAAIRSFLTKHDDFDLQKSNIDLFLKEKKLNGDKNRAMRDELKSVQRIFKLGLNYSKTNALLQKNIHSSQKITAVGESRFVEEIAPEAGIGKTEAREVFKKAERANTAAMLIVGELQDTLKSMDISALQTASLSTKLEAIGKDFPNLKTLFKLTDLCACEHCRSVYSPAAYLVEILEFLDKRNVFDLTGGAPVANRNAKDALFFHKNQDGSISPRRADLGDIDLNCENANTPIPYIDLVCELLEEVVAPDAGIQFTGNLSGGTDPLTGIISNNLFTKLTTGGNNIPVTNKALIFATETTSGSSAALPHYLRDKKTVCKITHNGGNTYTVKQLRQTLNSAQELAAAPAYVNSAAYDILRNEVYAFKLPFDLSYTEAKAYFSRFEIPRHELMSDFQVALSSITLSPSDKAIAAENLGLTNRERKMIVNPRPGNQKQYWNTTSSNAAGEMNNVDTFLTKTGLTYKELNLLLSLKFIDSPAGNLFIKHEYDDPTVLKPAISCDTTKKKIANLDDIALDRIHRFLRWQKKMGWKFETLDEIISQTRLGNGELDDKDTNANNITNGNECLIKASDLVKISRETGIKLEELLGFFGEIPHEELADSVKKPLYHQIFLNKAKNGFIDDNLLPDKVDGTQQLKSLKTTLSVCLQVTEQDFDKLLSLLADGTVKFENLSALYAASVLVRKLKLKVDDFIILIKLIGPEITGSPDPLLEDITSSPATTLKFVRALIASRKFPLKPANINFMLRHEAVNLADREIKNEKIEQILKKLQADYKKAHIAHQTPFDENLTADEQKETLQNLLSKLTGIGEEDVKTFILFIDGNWKTVGGSAPDAVTFVNDKLGNLFDVSAISSAIIDLDMPGTSNLESLRNELVRAFMKQVSAYLYDLEIRNLLRQNISAAFKSDTELTAIVLNNARLKQGGGNNLLGDLLRTLASLNKPVTETDFYNQYDAIRLLHKLFPLINSFKLKNENVLWHLENNFALGWFELDSIPYKTDAPPQTPVDYSKYASFVEIVSIAKRLTPVSNPVDATEPITFYKVAEMTLDVLTPSTTFIPAYSLLNGYEKDDVTELDIYLFSAFNIINYRELKTWKIIQNCIGHLRKLGATVAQVTEFIKPALTGADTNQLRMALKARYDDEVWLDTLKQITDVIRPQKRDALVAYLLATNPEMKDENDLYDYFLVDVEMESCMPSARIPMAHWAIQLFVQRCLMGLEPKAAADIDNDTGWKQWEWMKNYRVWEANRKVFVNPENFIEPDLRDDKSFLFEELEKELLQNELSEFTAEEALIKYLEKLDNLAFLEVVATWYQSNISTMHIFARTKGGDPPIYYYRKFEKERYFTPWEKIDVDITGDHLLAFERNNRLSLAWLIFSEETEPKPKVQIPDNTAGTEVALENPKRKTIIQLAISELANKKWQPKKVSNESVLTPLNYTIDLLPKERYNLRYVEQAQQIMILNTSLVRSAEEHTVVGIFNIVGCKGYPEVVPLKAEFRLPDFLPDFKDSVLTAQRYKELNLDQTDDLAVKNGFSFYSFLSLLEKTPGNFNIAYPNQVTNIDLLLLLFQYLMHFAFGGYLNQFSIKMPMGNFLPYFMEDGSHAYVIVPGFYNKEVNSQTGAVTYTKRTGSDILRLIGDVCALYTKYTRIYNDMPPPKDSNRLMEQLRADRDYEKITRELRFYQNSEYREQFKNMYHPLVCPLRTALYKKGIAEMMRRETQMQISPFDFNTNYQPTGNVLPQYPVEEIDFSSDGSYSGYNWELFFHIPFLMASRLSQNQRFEEALKWFHYVFNPTGALSGAVPQKYWVTKPFHQMLSSEYIEQRIDNLLYRIANPGTPEIAELEFAVNEWRDKPFNPHVIARFRKTVYPKALLMKYIDNLTAWGDNLFRQDTLESIAQATQMYILADKLLGPKPRIIPPVVKPPPETYNQMEGKLDAFGNALIDLENIMPDLTALPEHGNELPPPPVTLSTLYFCVPQNDKMLKYWELIESRLFNIRHCRNIDGIERSLALFAPTIDPSLLVRAAAAGLDISSILAGINAPSPYYRFNILAQKATELIQEVRSLGNSLLQTMEKKDAEALALLRSELEIKVLNAVRDMKVLQIKEAKEQIEILKKTKAVTEERHKYYANIEKINSNEQLNLDKLGEANELQRKAQISQTLAGIFAMLPDLIAGASGFGGSPYATLDWGGKNLSQSARTAGDILNILSSAAAYEANRASVLGGYDRRFDDWKLQERLAEKELVQINRQIIAAEIREEIAKNDLKNHDLQIENAEKTDEFMRSKFTNKELYDWMIGQISSVYFRAYQLAFDCAKKAERCYQFELGNSDTFIGFGYWNSLKKGLLCGDNLFFDLKRMETNYLESKREYELTKHISLAMLDPLALLKLRETGVCYFEIPEAVYDMDHPGHYFRRFKSVSFSVPCISGPYTSVSARISLVKNKYRKSNSVAEDYAEDVEGATGFDDRFKYNIGNIQSTATSSAQNDSGMFELNFRDERYLTFEGCGAISSWRLELPGEVRQFDYNTISDVIFHVKYTAREGGSSLQARASAALKDMLDDINQELNETGLHTVLNMRHDMPNEWNLLKKNAVVNLKIDKSRLPYFAQTMNPGIENVIFLARFKNTPSDEPIKIGTDDISLISSDWNLYKSSPETVINIGIHFDLSVSQADLVNLDDLLMVVKYSFEESS